MNWKKVRILTAQAALKVSDRHMLTLHQQAELDEKLQAEVKWGLVPMSSALEARAEEFVQEMIK